MVSRFRKVEFNFKYNELKNSRLMILIIRLKVQNQRLINLGVYFLNLLESFKEKMRRLNPKIV